MTNKEKEILEATKYFAESNDLPYDTYIESIILNAIREAIKPLKQQNDELLEALKEIEKQTSCFHTGKSINPKIRKEMSEFKVSHAGKIYRDTTKYVLSSKGKKFFTALKNTYLYKFINQKSEKK